MVVMTRRLKSSLHQDSFAYMRCPSLSSVDSCVSQRCVPVPTTTQSRTPSTDYSANKFQIPKSQTTNFEHVHSSSSNRNSASEVSFDQKHRDYIQYEPLNDSFSTVTRVTSCDELADYASIVAGDSEDVPAPPSTPLDHSRRRYSDIPSYSNSSNVQIMSCKDAQKYLQMFFADSLLLERHRNCRGFQVTCKLCRMSLYYCPYCQLQFSSSTDRNFASRLMPMPRQRQRKKRKKPFPRRMGGRASSFSSITDSTMSLNIITVTLSMETTSFLGISIVGQTHKQGDGGIYVGTIMPGGAVAQDGRIEPGDMILQVNEYSFENMSNDDAVKILRDVVVRPGPIKLVVAKCWNPNPQSYLSLPKNDHVNMRSTAGDPQGWVEQTSRMMTYKNGSGSGPMSPSLASVTSDGSFSSSLPESAGAAANHAQHQHPHHAQGAASGGAPPQPPPYLSNPGSNPGTANSAGSSGTPGSGGPRGMNGTPIFGMSSGGEFDPNMMQHLSTKTDVLSVLRAIQMPNSGLEIKDRMWLKITIPNAFLGHSLVDWLFEHLDGFSVRRDAHKYASRLLKEGYIKHTTGKASFSEQCYYIFNSEHAITNMNNLSYPTGGDNSNAGANMKQRDPLEMDEENDVLAPLPYTTPWGPPQYIGYQPRTAGYQGVPGQPGMVAPGFTVNELDSFGPMSQAIPSSMAQQMSGNSGMTNGGHSSPGSSNSSNRSGGGVTGGGSGMRNKGGRVQQLSDSLSDLDCSASQRIGATSANNEYFVDPM